MAHGDRKESEYLAIGNIVGAHGVRGEIKVELWTEQLGRFRPGQVVYLGDDSEAVAVEIASARLLPGKNRMLVKLASVPDRTAAESLRGRQLLIRTEEAAPLEEHENYLHDLIGLRVETASGELLGELTEVLVTRAHDVYVVKGAEGELLLPALRSVVMEVNLEQGKMVVVVPEGLR